MTPKSILGQNNDKKPNLDRRSKTNTERKIKEGKTLWVTGEMFTMGLSMSRFGYNKLDTLFRDEIINYVLGQVYITSKGGTGIIIYDEYSRVIDIFRDYNSTYKRLE